ncbi:MAG: hypothetical protein M1815_002023 [Lichina confinis]|nr:MAG: hypothetical protein M1815_002023 [Lichina confinis]
MSSSSSPSSPSSPSSSSSYGQQAERDWLGAQWDGRGGTHGTLGAYRVHGVHGMSGANGASWWENGSGKGKGTSEMTEGVERQSGEGQQGVEAQSPVSNADPPATSARARQTPPSTSMKASGSTDAAAIAVPWPSSLHDAQKPTLANHTRLLVVASTKAEDTSWIAQMLPEVRTAVYVVDDPEAAFHTPGNKGHEVMVYLTYIVDHYNELVEGADEAVDGTNGERDAPPPPPDVLVFMHAHRWSMHNNELQDLDAAQMIQDLNYTRVVQEGYVNLRCQWKIGCPAHLHPLSDIPDMFGLQAVVREQWPLLFPDDDAAVPETLAHPCCGQFAVSRERLLSVPRERFVAYRDWLLQSPLPDHLSGRLWEYLWQYVFAGKAVLCPEEHICYCQGYGLCFGRGEGDDEGAVDDEKGYAEFLKLRDERDQLEVSRGGKETDLARKTSTTRNEGMDPGLSSAAEAARAPEGKKKTDDLEKEIMALRSRIQTLNVVIDKRKEDARARARARART